MDDSPGHTEVLMLCGSLRAGSTNEAVLATAAATAPPGVRGVTYRGAAALPHFNPDDDVEGAVLAPAVTQLRAAVAAADAVLICTPEYAGALPGVLKTILEWTVGDAGTYRKPVAWINCAGPASPTGAADAHASLRKVLGYVGAHIVEAACVRVPVTRDMVVGGAIVDGEARARIAAAMQALVESASMSMTGSRADG